MDVRTYETVTKVIDPKDLYRFQNNISSKIIVYFNSGEAATPWIVATHDGVAVSRIHNMYRDKVDAIAHQMELMDNVESLEDEPGFSESTQPYLW